jgi:homoserine kinase type II
VACYGSGAMALLTAMSLDEALRAGAEFGLEVTAIAALRAGSVNSNFRLEARDGRRFFLRVYEEQDAAGAARELALVGELAGQGVPTPRPLGARLAEHAGKPVAIFPWVDGETLCQARVTPEHAAGVGAALAGVHLAHVSQVPEGRFGVSDLEARLDGIERVEGFRDASRAVRARLRKETKRRDAALPSGVIHGDLFRDNVLWSGGEVAALLDFESASRGSFAYDLMVCVLAWCFGDGFDTALACALVAGYEAVRPLEPSERASLGNEAALVCLRFATTRITDYALRAPPGEAPLRDYRRFLARLDAIDRGALGGI